jgi:6-phosphofructokinase 1
MSKKICVIASGGDAPGMNACCEAIFRAGSAKGFEVWAGINGFNGLINDNFVKMTLGNAVGISDKSGCVFKCGRAQNFLEHDTFARAVSNFKKHGFEGLICLGGNGSTNGCGRLKNAGLNVIVIPGTIDNDVDFSEHSLGFDSACEAATRAVDSIRATMETSDRNFIIEIMGRHCNKLTEKIGYSVFADIVDMDGQRYTAPQIAEMFAANRKNGKPSNFIIMQERKGTEYVQQSIDTMIFIKEIITATKDKDIRLTSVGYLQRGAYPTMFDRFLARAYGEAAVDCVIKKQFGVGTTMENGKVILKDVPIAPIP